MAHKPRQADGLVLSRDQVRACDGVAIERFGIDGLVLMENAGGSAARLILSLLSRPGRARVVIVAGTGNNGGDGFVVARHLANEKVDVDVVVCGRRERIKGDALRNLAIIEKMTLPLTYIDETSAAVIAAGLAGRLEGAEVIVDAMLGTGTAGPAREAIRTAIQTINECRQGKTVVALDIPSGLDCDSGEPVGIAVRAHHTVTFAAMKKGFQLLNAASYTGDVTVASIGIDAARLQD